jgi:hypothetical protein
MLRIRKEQMEVLSDVMRASFIQQEVARLQKDFAPETQELGISEAELPGFVGEAIDKAASYEVSDEQDVELFIDCRLMLSRDFDTDSRFPWAGSTLQRSDLTGTEKMSLIHDHLLFTVK